MIADRWRHAGWCCPALLCLSIGCGGASVTTTTPGVAITATSGSNVAVREESAPPSPSMQWLAAPPATQPMVAVEEPIVAAPPGPCPPNAAWIGGTCLSLEGTVWRITTDMPEGRRIFVLTFLPGGRLHSGDPVDTTTDNDEWEQQGAQVHFWFNHRYVQHNATWTDPRRLQGTTLNVNRQSWPWVAERIQ